MDRTLELSSGRVIELIPVGQKQLNNVMAGVEAEFRARGEPLDPPTYTTSVGEVFQWTAEGVAKDGTDEDKAAWAAHINAAARCEAVKEERCLKTWIIRGIKPEDRTPPPDWVEEQAWLGVILPIDARDLSIEYVQIDVLKTPDDIAAFSGKMVALSMEGAVSEEEARAIEDTFRDSIHQAIGRISLPGRDTANVGSGSQDGTEMDVPIPDAGSTDSGELESQPQPV